MGNPGAADLYSFCDGEDNDCDGQTDEEGIIDADNDGFAAEYCSSSSIIKEPDNDCDDNNANANPDSVEQGQTVVSGCGSQSPSHSAKPSPSSSCSFNGTSPSQSSSMPLRSSVAFGKIVGSWSLQSPSATVKLEVAQNSFGSAKPSPSRSYVDPRPSLSMRSSQSLSIPSQPPANCELAKSLSAGLMSGSSGAQSPLPAKRASPRGTDVPVQFKYVSPSKSSSPDTVALLQSLSKPSQTSVAPGKTKLRASSQSA